MGFREGVRVEERAVRVLQQGMRVIETRMEHKKELGS